MAITTYAELKAAAANWLVRGDLTERIPEFVALAEARLNRVLRTRLAEAEAPLTVPAGARRVAVPPGFTEPLRLWRVADGERLELPFIEAARLAPAPARGVPSAWTIDGADVALDRPCDAPCDLVLRLLTAFRLSDAAPTNALLDEAPDVYLYATLCEAGPLLRDLEQIRIWEARLGEAVSALNAKSARSRAPGVLATEVAGLIGARAW